MKKILILILFISFSSHAQIGGLVKKAKNKIEKKETETKTEPVNENSTKSSESTSNANVNDSKPKPTKIDKSEGITSPTHQKFVNKIVFSSKEASILKKAEIEADFKNEFNYGDPIYFRVYFSKTIEQSLEPIDDGSSTFEHGINLEFKFYLNDVLIDNFNGKFQDGDIDQEVREQWTTLRGAFKSVDNSIYMGMFQFNNFIRLNGDKFKIGKNKLKIEIYPISWDNFPKGEVIASGEITLNVKNSVINPNDPELCMPQAMMKDDVLIKNIVKNHSEEKAGFKVDPKNIRIISQKWDVYKNHYGTPLNRTLNVCAGYKDPSDNKCYRNYYIVIQEYVGSKFENETYFLKTNIRYDTQEINCGCLSK